MKQEFQIKGELITLDALLKAVGAADSGAHAKAMVAEGLEGLTVVLKADSAFAARD